MKTPCLNNLFGSDCVTAFTTDAGMDFTLNESASALTPDQKEYLNRISEAPYDRLLWLKQVHGDGIFDARSIEPGRLHEGDALMTRELNIPIAVRTADCLPIFIYDPKTPSGAVVHAGWKSTYLKIGPKTIGRLQSDYGADPTTMQIAFGPAIRACCYQVGPEFVDRFPEAIVRRDGELYLDLIRENKNQLAAAGIRPEQIHDCGLCTYCNRDFFSYRRQQAGAGRMISILIVR